MRRSFILGGLLCLLSATHVWAQASLENPPPGSNQSGIGLVSGWKCTAGTVTVQFDNSPQFPAAYGTPRGDTQAACGDTNNGFGLLWNYNLLGDGQHTLRLFDNGAQFAETTFTVTTFGQEFMRGENGTITGSFASCRVALVWEEGQQNFAVAETALCLRPFLGQWEFVVKKPSGDEKNHYAFNRIELRLNPDTKQAVDDVIGTDLDHGGEVELLRSVDLDPSVNYDFTLGSLTQMNCELFVFNQVSPTSVRGVGVSFPADPFSVCRELPTPRPAVNDVIGTRTGAALAAQNELPSPVSPLLPGNIAETTISSELISELLGKTLPFIPR